MVFKSNLVARVTGLVLQCLLPKMSTLIMSIPLMSTSTVIKRFKNNFIRLK